MDEPKTEAKTETEEEQPAEDTGTGNLPATTPLIDIANQAAERMEKANEETARLLARQEELEQRRALGGRAEAGKPSEPVEDSPKEYAEKVMSNDLDGKED